MEAVELLVEAMERMTPRIPINIDLWSVKEIAAFLKRSEAVVRDRIVHTPGFPKAIRLPTGGGKRGQPLWRAKEVVEWVGKHQDS